MAYTKTNLASTTAANTSRFVTSTNMKVGAYTLANTTSAHGAGFIVTATITAVTGNDTAGTLVVVGKNLAGQTVTETITLTAGTGGTGTQIFKSLTSVTGAGWVINTGNDTIVIGHATDAYVMDGSGVLYAIVINSTAAGTLGLSDASGTFATLKASIAENTYYFECEVAGYLKVSHTSTMNYTLIHTASIPTYATA